MSHASKRKGYDLEVQAAKALSSVFPGIRRTGSVAYKKAAADLVQEGTPSLPLVVTRDKRGAMLVSLSVDDLVRLMDAPDHHADIGVVVQCKKREKTWLGTLYAELKEATRA